MGILNDRQINDYFTRIKYGGRAEITAETLKDLQKCHLKNIPYENLDILAGRPLSLERQELFEKIIRRNRGGYCFELQGLYGDLLTSLGFKITQYAGRYMNEGGIQMRRHRVLVAELEGEKYLCDVGVFGEMPRAALKLEAGLEQSDGISTYQFGRDDFYGWTLNRLKKESGWGPVYGFTEEPQLDMDYIMPCFHCEKHPDSPFNKKPMISIFTEDSSLTFQNDLFKVYRNEKVEECTEVQGVNEVKKLVYEKFGLVMPEME